MAGQSETVSVIVPTHNRAAYLKRALDSIRAQTYSNMEVIVIANGCADATAQVARDFQRQLESQPQTSPAPPIDFIFRDFKETLGGARARNLGLDCARGTYIAFLDDDDCWHPDKLSTQVALLNRYDCALVGSDYFYWYGPLEHEQTRPAGRAAGESTVLRFDDLTCENKLGGFSLCLTRRSRIGKLRIDEQLQALQDWDLWLKILAAGGNARISPQRHVHYRIDGERISNRYAQIAAAQRHFLSRWRDRLNAPSIAYHEMRLFSFQMKVRAGAAGETIDSKQNIFEKFSTWFCVIARWPWFIKTIHRSSERGNIKRYIHYMLLPLFDIDAIRMRLWRIGIGNKRAQYGAGDKVTPCKPRNA